MEVHQDYKRYEHELYHRIKKFSCIILLLLGVINLLSFVYIITIWWYLILFNAYFFFVEVLTFIIEGKKGLYYLIISKILLVLYLPVAICSDSVAWILIIELNSCKSIYDCDIDLTIGLIIGPILSLPLIALVVYNIILSIRLLKSYN